MNESRLATALQKAFANELINPYVLGRRTAMLFSDSMNERLQKWFHVHWSFSYPVDKDEPPSPQA